MQFVDPNAIRKISSFPGDIIPDNVSLVDALSSLESTVAEHKYYLNYTTPELYGAKADGVTDDSAAINAAIAAANITKATVRFSSSGIYAHSGISATNLDVRLDGNGARLVRLASAPNNRGMNFINNLTDVTAVTSVIKTTYTFPGDGAASDVSAITVTGFTATVGDVLRIISDDLNPSSEDGSNERIGESFEVGGVVGNIIYTRSPLVETYTTGIRICKMVPRVLSIRGFDMSDQAGYPETRTAAMIYVQGFIEPSIENVHIHDSASYGLQYKVCHRMRTNGLNASRLRTYGNNALGYGIHALSSCYSVHIGSIFNRVRHGFTTGTLSVTTGGDIHNFGACIGARILNSSAFECENAAWDTHPDSYDTAFIGCSATGKTMGVGTTTYQIQLRGRNDRALNCYTKGASAITINAPRSGTYRTVIKGHVHSLAEGVTIASSCISIGSSNNFLQCEIDIDAEVGNNNFIGVTNARVTGSVRGKVINSTGSSNFWIQAGANATLDLDLIDVDLQNATGSTPRLFAASYDTSRINARYVRVRRGSNAAAWSVGQFGEANGTILVDTLEADVLPSTSSGGFQSLGATSVGKLRNISVNGVSNTTSPKFLTNSSVTLNNFVETVLILDVALTTARTVTLPSGFSIPAGRIFTFVRTANSTGASALTIATPGSEALTTLATGASARVLWTGTSWILLS